MKIKYWKTRTCGGYLLVICLVLSAIGCRNSSIAEVEDLETVSLYSQSDQLAQTMEYIRSLDRYEMDSFREKVNSGLNRWASNQNELAADWQIPDLANTLPTAITSEPSYNNLNDTSFYANDADYIQESYWLKEIANRIIQSNAVFQQEYLYQTAHQMADDTTLDNWEANPDDLLTGAMTLIHPELMEGEDVSKVKQLAQAIKLFDWSVRNIQLYEAAEWPNAESIKDNSVDTDADVNGFPPATGTAGPGYTRYSWQVLTYGKGDFIERAKVFAGLCQQVGIPVAILAVPTDDESQRPYEEWLCGALIGGQLYLFDPLLGLPIHGKKPGTIATLADVRKDPTILSQLDLTTEESIDAEKYRVTPEDLDHVIALVVAPPESISKRMQAVEENLAGENRLNLTVDTAQLAQQFEKIDGIQSVALWHVPFSTQLFREKVAEQLTVASFDSDVASRLRPLLEQEQYINDFIQLRTARNCFLRGIFQSELERDIRSAISYYYSFMYSDDEIGRIETDELLQRQLGIWKGTDQSFAEWQNQVLRMKQYMGVVRADAAFFLSLCSYENDMPFTTLKWLQRIRNYDDDKRWSEYLPYYRGRAYESSGKYDAAAKEYASDESAQKHGSILRKRWLDQLNSGTNAEGS